MIEMSFVRFVCLMVVRPSLLINWLGWSFLLRAMRSYRVGRSISNPYLLLVGIQLSLMLIIFSLSNLRFLIFCFNMILQSLMLLFLQLKWDMLLNPCPLKKQPVHFLNGPSDALCSFLAPLFSAMINRHYVPPSFTVSYIIPLLKGKSLDPTNPNNYRGISISSIFSKLFESVILDLIYSSTPISLHNLQGGFRKGYSTSHTSFIVQEAILSCKEQHLKCYSAFLDARKAFDTVWHSG